MDFSLSEFKKNNSLLVWYSEKDIKDLIVFLDKNRFSWNKEKNQYHNEEIDIYLEQEDLVKIINDNNFLFEKIKKTLKKRDRKDNYVVDDVRVAGYYINLFVFLGIINLFLGWIFFNPIFWITTQIFLLLLFLAFFKMRKKIIRKIKYNKLNVS